MRQQGILVDRMRSMDHSQRTVLINLTRIPAVMMIRNACPRCEGTDYKKNGKAHQGKQHYRCRRCGREFIRELERHPIAPEQQELVKKLLLERISLRGICRVVRVSLDWLLTFLVSL